MPFERSTRDCWVRIFQTGCSGSTDQTAARTAFASCIGSPTVRTASVLKMWGFWAWAA